MPTVDIFHFNDFHRRLEPLHNGTGGAARLSTLVHKLRASHPDSVLVNVGDVAGDHTAESPRAFEPIPQLFNHLGVEVLALGNHEFEDSSNGYQVLREGLLRGLKAETLCANVREAETGARIGNTKDYTMRRLAGINVAFIGVVTEQLTSAVHPTSGAGLRVARMKDVLMDLVPQVRREGADAVVVMAHEGIRGASALAREIPGIDVVLAAHDHRPTLEPVVVEREDGSKAWVAEGGAYGTSLGHLRLHVDGNNRRIVDVDGRQHVVTQDIEPDPVIQGIVDRFEPLPRAEHRATKPRWRKVDLHELKQTLEERAS